MLLSVIYVRSAHTSTSVHVLIWPSLTIFKHIHLVANFQRENPDEEPVDADLCPVDDAPFTVVADPVSNSLYD